jgi:hypothetical protein
MVTTQLIIDTMNNFHGTEMVSMDLLVPLSSEIQENLPSPMDEPKEEPKVVVKQENSSSCETI